MSLDAARQFLERAQGDDDLQRAISEAVTETDARNVITGQRMAELGRERGLAFAADELREALLSGDWDAEHAEDELSEDQLAQVAGGVIGDAGLVSYKMQPIGGLSNLYVLAGRRGDV